MKRIFYGVFLVAGLLFSCEKDESLELGEITETSTRNHDNQLLNELYQEILSISEQYDCTNALEWKFTAIGSKACGGPTGYIAYSINIDEDSFLEKIAHYTLQQKEYNTKWGIISDCAVVNTPSRVECLDGRPQLID